MTIKATFTGTNSLGYVKGIEYHLKISKGLSIERIDGTGYCPYQSLFSFLKNWNNISIVS